MRNLLLMMKKTVLKQLILCSHFICLLIAEPILQKFFFFSIVESPRVQNLTIKLNSVSYEKFQKNKYF